ncbi:hypothetical protein RFG22_02720 [Streptococcus ruminantium]|nr:hypothetical protein [Streptococcus ruminantium]MDQ8766655.1 hypothetical protein [Streptococcus ruminantium]MDQ8780444.1 hypothetical protein [Streptococcus ruminantium]MDQ8819932.1 hypothetical protein [Streptococcus ruminantium]
MEIWNAYTADGRLTDQILTRGKAIPKNIYHLVVSVSSATLMVVSSL